MHKYVVAMVAAATLAMVTTSGASAWASWCDTDPLILVVTPGGHIVPVYVDVQGQGLTNSPQVLASTILFTSYRDSAAGKKTAVDMTVYVPNGLTGSFATRATASSGPLRTGTVYASTSGSSGSTMHLRYLLNVP